MAIDNLSILEPFLKFESEDDFYYLQILRRKKDNPDIEMSNTSTIKNYFIRNVEYLHKKYGEIKELCRFFNARAYLRLNKRSLKKVAFRTLNNITAQMMQEDFHSAMKAYSNACGQCHNDKEKKWIVDLDDSQSDERWNLWSIDTFLTRLKPFGGKVLADIPTKNGVHLITKPFELNVFSEKYPGIDVHKDNPTILYCEE